VRATLHSINRPLQSLRHAAAAKSNKLEVGGSAAATASRAELLGRVLRRLHQQLLLPRCVKAWAAAATTAAAAWEEKDVDGPRRAAERLLPSPVNVLTTQNSSVKGHAAPAQPLRSSLVKGQTADIHVGWFSGGSVSPPSEAAGSIPLFHPLLVSAVVAVACAHAQFCSVFFEAFSLTSFDFSFLRRRTNFYHSPHTSCHINRTRQPRSPPRNSLNTITMCPF
jgi:hypothetical protein